MNAGDDVGSGDNEVIVAAFQAGSAKVLGSEFMALDIGAHGSVKDEDAIAE